MKIIKVKESQLKMIVESIIKEKSENLKEGMNPGTGIEGFVQQEEFPKRELKRKETGFRKREFDPYPKESQILSIFGPYADDLPPQILQFMRKNPKYVAEKLRMIYGKKY